MPTQIQPERSKFLAFFKTGTSDSGITEIIAVHSKQSQALLGGVLWHAAWRKYCFFPSRDTVFDEACLDDIQDFLRDINRAHAAARKERKQHEARHQQHG